MVAAVLEEEAGAGFQEVALGVMASREVEAARCSLRIGALEWHMVHERIRSRAPDPNVALGEHCRLT